VAKHRTVTHLPAPPSSPRLAGQLFTAIGELIAVAVFGLGVWTLAAWLLWGDAVALPPGVEWPRPGIDRAVWRCHYDPQHGERCWPTYRIPERRHFVRDIY
jgi:hypothetical protein